MNSFYLIQSSLSAFSFTDSEIKTDAFDDLIAREVMALVQEQFESMLKVSGLANLLEALKSLARPLSQHAQTSPNAVTNAMSHFDRFLLGITMDVTESLYRIQSLDIAKRVSQQGSLLFLNAYRSIVKDIEDPSNNVFFLDIVSTRFGQTNSPRSRNFTVSQQLGIKIDTVPPR